MDVIYIKTTTVSIQNKENLLLIAKALSNPLRLSIIELLSETSYTVNEIASKLKIPVSTAAVNIQILEEADIIKSIISPGIRGYKKLCSRKYDSFTIELEHQFSSQTYNESIIEIPIGSFNDCDIKPTCGMVSEFNFLIPEDVPEFFFTPNRFKAELLWFTEGYVNYKFYNPITTHMKVESIEISFEACSEAPQYRNVYKSDISILFNDVFLGYWTCKGDYGGRRGMLNPRWWSDSCTQYGELKTWKITHNCTLLDDVYFSPVSIKDIDIYAKVYNLKIAVFENAKNKGGINIFGKHFGDYGQNIIIKIKCT